MTRFQSFVMGVFAVALAGAIAVFAVMAVKRPAAERAETDLDRFGQAPTFQLKSSTGADFDSALLTGKVWIADFFFTNCKGICPKLTSSMKRIQEATVGFPEIQLVSMSVDPARDNPAVLSDYGKKFGSDFSRWHFLTGEKGQVKTISQQGFSLGATEVPGDILHSNRLILVDRTGEIRGYYTGTEDSDVAKLIEDAKRLAASEKQ